MAKRSYASAFRYRKSFAGQRRYVRRRTLSSATARNPIKRVFYVQRDHDIVPANGAYTLLLNRISHGTTELQRIGNEVRILSVEVIVTYNVEQAQLLDFYVFHDGRASDYVPNNQDEVMNGHTLLYHDAARQRQFKNHRRSQLRRLRSSCKGFLTTGPNARNTGCFRYYKKFKGGIRIRYSDDVTNLPETDALLLCISKRSTGPNNGVKSRC